MHPVGSYLCEPAATPAVKMFCNRIPHAATRCPTVIPYGVGRPNHPLAQLGHWHHRPTRSTSPLRCRWDYCEQIRVSNFDCASKQRPLSNCLMNLAAIGAHELTTVVAALHHCHCLLRSLTRLFPNGKYTACSRRVRPSRINS